MRATITSTRLLLIEDGKVTGFSSIDLVVAEAGQDTAYTAANSSRGRSSTIDHEPGQFQWFVDLTRKNGEVFRLILSNIENQPTWTNDKPGADACVAALQQLIQSPASFGGGTYDYNELFNRPTFGSAAFLDAGVAPSNVVQLDAFGKLPPVDGSQLTGLPSGGVSTFVALTDGPGGYAGNAKKVVQVNGAETKLEYGPVLGSAAEANVSDFDAAGTGAAAAAAAVAAHVAAVDPHGDRAYADAKIAAIPPATFEGLPDGPGLFSGNALLQIRVNAGETALEYFTPVAGPTTLPGLTDGPGNYGATPRNILRANATNTGWEWGPMLGTLATQNGTFSGTSSGTNTGDQTLAQVLALGRATDGTGFGIGFVPGDAAAMAADTGGGGTLIRGPLSTAGSFTARLKAQDGNILLDSDIGTTVQGWDTDLQAIGALTPSNDDFLQRKAGAWTNRSIAQVKTDLLLAGANTGDQTISITGDGTAAGSTGALALTNTKMNGVAYSGLATGLVKNTTGTGVPSIAVAGTDYLAPAAIGTTVQGFRSILTDIGTVFATSSAPAQALTTSTYVNVTGASLANVPIGTYLSIAYVTYDAPTVSTGIGLNFASTGAVSDFAILASYSVATTDASTAQANAAGGMPAAVSSRVTTGNTAMLIGILTLSAIGTVTLQARLELGVSGITVQNVNSMKLIRMA